MVIIDKKQKLYIPYVYMNQSESVDSQKDLFQSFEKIAETSKVLVHIHKRYYSQIKNAKNLIILPLLDKEQIFSTRNSYKRTQYEITL